MTDKEEAQSWRYRVQRHATHGVWAGAPGKVQALLDQHAFEKWKMQKAHEQYRRRLEASWKRRRLQLEVTFRADMELASRIHRGHARPHTAGEGCGARKTDVVGFGRGTDSETFKTNVESVETFKPPGRPQSAFSVSLQRRPFPWERQRPKTAGSHGCRRRRVSTAPGDQERRPARMAPHPPRQFRPSSAA
eukprot:scaffold7116_cov296-Pinguiococcus_pyrenoidosus.AAC.6